RLFATFSMALYVFIACFAPYIVSVMAGKDYAPAVSVVPFLALAALFANMYIFAPGLGIAKKTGMIAGINIICAVLNAILNYALIPHLGIVGAAVATLFASFCAF